LTMRNLYSIIRPTDRVESPRIEVDTRNDSIPVEDRWGDVLLALALLALIVVMGIIATIPTEVN
jgi:hypothetical protein